MKSFLLTGGYYSKLVSRSPPIRAVVPNSNLYYTNNPLDLGSDPGGQFAWLEAALSDAQQQGEKVGKEFLRKIIGFILGSSFFSS